MSGMSTSYTHCTCGTALPTGFDPISLIARKKGVCPGCRIKKWLRNSPADKTVYHAIDGRQRRLLNFLAFVEDRAARIEPVNLCTCCRHKRLPIAIERAMRKLAGVT